MSVFGCCFFGESTIYETLIKFFATKPILGSHLTVLEKKEQISVGRKRQVYSDGTKRQGGAVILNQPSQETLGKKLVPKENNSAIKEGGSGTINWDPVMTVLLTHSTCDEASEIDGRQFMLCFSSQ